MLQAIKDRRSIRKFQDKNCPDEIIKDILLSGMCAPSGCNTKGYELVVVKDKELLKKISKLGKWLDFIEQSSFTVVIISKEYTFWIEDGSLVALNMMLEAVNLGLGSCWGDIKDGQELDNTDREIGIKALLNIPSEYKVLCAIAFGYPDQKIMPHKEEEYKSNKVHFDFYK